MKAHLLVSTACLLALVAPSGLAQEKKKAKPADVDPFAEAPRKQARKLTPKEQREMLPKLLQVQCEWIELEHEALTKLMFGRDPKGDSTGLRKEVQELVLKGEAGIIDTAIAMCRSGQKATTESIKEHIYPTEYEPAQIPNEIDLGKTDPTAEALAQLVVPPSPTAFETRNVGTTLEIEATLSVDEEVIDLRFAPEIVQHTGTAKWQTIKDDLGNENHVQMPLFYSMRTSTGLTLRDGQYRLAAVLSPKGDDGETDRSRKVMMFLKCDVVVIGEESIRK